MCFGFNKFFNAKISIYILNSEKRIKNKDLSQDKPGKKM